MKKAKGVKGDGGSKKDAAGALPRKRRARSRESMNEGLEALVLLMDLIDSSGGGLPPPETPLDMAEEIVAEAWMSENARRRKALARKALAVSPDCVDAYVLLAAEAPSPEEARSLLEEAIMVGERVLGPQAFQEDVGEFWGLIETRPYMRAREMLASCLWRLGDREAAIAHYRELLRLNPNDNQGIRYLLARCFLETGQDEELTRLLASYADDASAVWMYTAVLLAFRQKGATVANEKKLAKALEANPFVPDYLLGRRRLPRRMPDLIGMGDESEAVDYAAAHKVLWEQTPGALDWLRHARGGRVLPI